MSEVREAIELKRPAVCWVVALFASLYFVNAAMAAELYVGMFSPLTVATDQSVALIAADNGRPVPLKIFYPVSGEAYPLIVLSHGTFSSIERYDRVADYWAGQGYVVILPQHIDANYGVKPSSYEFMQNVAMTRVADMSLVLNELDAIEQSVPALAGKIDRAHYVAAGHSMGTQVAMLATGLRFKASYNDVLVSAEENRFEALILVSDPGKMRLMPLDTWTGSGVPTFMATGTEDFGLMGQRGEPTETQSEIQRDGAAGVSVDRWALLLENGDHYFGGLIQKDVDAEPDHEGLEIFNATSTAFLDAYIKDDARAMAYLLNVDLSQATNQRAGLALSASTAQPVIDMHFHAWPYGADGGPEHPKNLEVMNAAIAGMKKYNVVLATASGPSAFVDYWGAEAPDRLLLGPVLPCPGGLNPNWYQYPCYPDKAEFPDPDWLRERYENGTYGVMGEIFTQYAGMEYDDPRMDPYYTMAEELGIPVAFHTHSAPPLTASRCCPEFRIAYGDPLKLENVLVRYPKLKVQIMHANPLVYPMVLDLMQQFPKVYAEISPFQRILKREKFHRLLMAFKEAGMLSRVMFGTDGDDYGKAIDAYRSADFLSAVELEGLLCKNAARFLRRRELCETGVN